ncbi:MAG: hydrolase family protein [Ramlibacter sp.]|jgi:2-keto-4-pentenoate hydratase/2-oxohepta-3-ene-1,7-dioic acid hydratase in catechol pathway|nr:hydrolase family protein [Ramlibacter sp.]
MKIINFESPTGPRVGAMDGEAVVDFLALNEAAPFLPANLRPALHDTISLIRDWDALQPMLEKAIAGSRTGGAGRLQRSAVKLLAPMLPTSILCSGSNYLSHNQEKANADVSGKEPEFFIKTADCVVGPGQPIVLDRVLTSKLDGEVELAVVIGKSGRHIPADKALDHVFGYSIVNDVTARDRQVRRRPDGSYWYELGRGKFFDSSAPMGPCITTCDEIPDPQAVMVRSWVNGDLRQISSTSQMIWTVAQLVHFFSVNVTLRPGMVIITGTPSGTAWSCDAELGGKWAGTDGMVRATGYLKDGDKIVCEIEGIGRLENPVVENKR